MNERHEELDVPAWDLADRMSKALRESGMTPAQMALYLDVHRNTISNYLHGRSRPTRAVLIAWSGLTRFPLEWIEHGDQPRPPSPVDANPFVSTPTPDGNDRYRRYYDAA